MNTKNPNILSQDEIESLPNSFYSHAEAIYHLNEVGIEVKQTRVAEWLGVSRANVSQVIGRMQNNGLIELTDELKRNVNVFRNISDISDEKAAFIAREDSLDIAVDLMGYMKKRGLSIFSLRVAPIQISYLGYPGTTGSDGIDYLIADEHLIKDEERFYSEKIIKLNNIWNAHSGFDFKREFSETPAKKNNYNFPYVQDPKAKLAYAFGATKTPHIYLFNNNDILTINQIIGKAYNNTAPYSIDVVFQRPGSVYTIDETGDITLESRYANTISALSLIHI